MPDIPEEIMQKWRDYLTDDERQRMQQIPREREKLTEEYKAIYDRARMRMYRAASKSRNTPEA